MKLVDEVEQVLDMEEANLSRLFKHMNDKSIGIISAYRLVYSRDDKEFNKLSKDKDPLALRIPKKVNTDNTNSLLSELRALGYGPTKLMGTYEEKNPVTGKVDTIKEVSFFVQSGSGDGGQKLRDDLKKLGKKYNQDSILYRGKGDTAGTEIVRLKSGAFGGVVGKWSPGELSDMMSKLRNRPFTFKSVGKVVHGKHRGK
jgi:hypothetical protein